MGDSFILIRRLKRWLISSKQQEKTINNTNLYIRSEMMEQIRHREMEDDYIETL
jgi:hypothetical protein